MTFLRMILLCVAAAAAYGIAHDQVTARACVEYFTIGHPAIFATQSPTLLAFGWGVLATWWVGLFLGIALAMSARAGRWPKTAVGEILRPIGLLLAAIALSAIAAGLAGYWAARSGRVFLTGVLANEIAAHRHARFIADLCAHNTAYAVGFVGGLVVCYGVLRSRRRRASSIKTGSALGNASGAQT